MSTATVLPLRCPGCGATLHGLPQDVVFWCEGCGALQEVVQDAFVQRTASVARAVQPPAGAVLHLPLWAFRVDVVWEWQEPARAAQARHIAATDWVYVTAFALHNAFYFGDPGVIFTQRRVALQPAESARAELAPILGCTRSLEEAKGYIEPHLLTIVDRRVDVTGLELACTIREAVLWGIPYFDEGEQLRDGILGLRIPAGAVDEIGSLRAWMTGRR